MKKRVSLIIFIVGLVTLLGGGGFLLYKILKQPDIRDAEFLVEVGEWAREDDDRVVWTFTEVGKGTLTVNNHANDYDFIWATEGDTLKIETDWFYNLEDEYTYSIDRSTKTLTLTAGEDSITFKATDKPEEPVEEPVEEPGEEPAAE